jgi:Uma2 family endonuclease
VGTAAWPDHLLSLAEWDALDPDPARRYELVEGVLVVVPRPSTVHQNALLELAVQLKAQLPARLRVLPEVEVVVDDGPAPTVRVPDLVVVDAATLTTNTARCHATDIRLAVEILSPGTTRTDRVMKLDEYADAGIPAYWIVDLDPPVTLSAHLLVDDYYELADEADTTISVLTPTDLTIDLTRLLP